jgi:hypothetical protein
MTISDKQALDDHKEIPWCTDARIAEKQIDIVKRAWRRANESGIRDLKAQRAWYEAKIAVLEAQLPRRLNTGH